MTTLVSKMKKLESYLVRAQIKIKIGPVKAENGGFEIEFPIMAFSNYGVSNYGPYMLILAFSSIPYEIL